VGSLPGLADSDGHVVIYPAAAGQNSMLACAFADVNTSAAARSRMRTCV